MAFSVNMSVRLKIMVLALGSALIMALTFVWVIPKIEGYIFFEKQEKTRNLVEVAASIVNHYLELEKQGKFTRKEAESRALADITDLRYMGDNYFFVTDYKAKMLMHPMNPALNGKDVSQTRDPNGVRVFGQMADTAKSKGQGFVDYYWPKPGSSQPQPKISYVKGIPQWQWVVGTGIYVDDVKAQIREITFTILSVVIGLFILTILASLLLSRTITAPLKNALDLVMDIARGEGDLTARLNITTKDEVGRLCQEFNRFVQKLHDLIVGIKESAQIVARSTDEISQGNQELSNRIQQQASSIEETSSAMEEMSGSVNKEADHAKEANTMAQKTANMADEGRQVVKNAVEAMAEVNDSSAKINEIITVVNEIAFQTNLLALNAAVEAARAGEAGRGFAVVAGEVRNLAGRSATAAKEIQELITDSVKKVDQGNNLVKESGRLLNDIIENVNSVAEITGEISSSIQEQAQGIGEVNKAVSLMDEAVQQNAALVEESASSAEEMAAAAEELNGQMNQFKVREGQSSRQARPTKKAAKTSALSQSKPAYKPEPAKAQPKPTNKDEDDFFGGADMDGFEEF